MPGDELDPVPGEIVEVNRVRVPVLMMHFVKAENHVGQQLDAMLDQPVLRALSPVLVDIKGEMIEAIPSRLRLLEHKARIPGLKGCRMGSLCQ